MPKWVDLSISSGFFTGTELNPYSLAQWQAEAHGGLTETYYIRGQGSASLIDGHEFLFSSTATLYPWDLNLYGPYRLNLVGGNAITNFGGFWNGCIINCNDVYSSGFRIRHNLNNVYCVTTDRMNIEGDIGNIIKGCVLKATNIYLGTGNGHGITCVDTVFVGAVS
ncbi:MAG: hypothetical protein HQK96_08295 [Nitrospirae bacterium]|nr:hypothetical protein [Nitrospirota bacterium]